MNEINLSDYNSLLEIAVALNLGATVFRSNIETLLLEITKYKQEKLLRAKTEIQDLEKELEKLFEAEEELENVEDIPKKNDLLEDIKKERITISEKITTKKLFVNRAKEMIEEYKKNDWRIKRVRYIIRFITPICALISIIMLFIGVYIHSLNSNHCGCFNFLCGYSDFIIVLFLISPAFVSFGLHYWHLKHEKVEFDKISEIINGNTQETKSFTKTS